MNNPNDPHEVCDHTPRTWYHTPSLGMILDKSGPCSWRQTRLVLIPFLPHLISQQKFSEVETMIDQDDIKWSILRLISRGVL